MTAETSKITPGMPGTELMCSARDCRADAVWGVLWNNPKIHTPERRKVWLACQEHKEYLEGYLGDRAYWKATIPVAELE